jgi:hypothetical protein
MPNPALSFLSLFDPCMSNTLFILSAYANFAVANMIFLQQVSAQS